MLRALALVLLGRVGGSFCRRWNLSWTDSRGGCWDVSTAGHLLHWRLGRYSTLMTSIALPRITTRWYFPGTAVI